MPHGASELSPKMQREGNGICCILYNHSHSSICLITAKLADNGNLAISQSGMAWNLALLGQEHGVCPTTKHALSFS